MFYLLLLLLATIPALKTLIATGFFASHDSEYHLVRLIHFFTEITKGQFPVRLSSELAHGYGYPVFNFFYPLIYYLSSLIHLIGFSFGNSLKIIVFLSLVLSVLFCYLWLRQHFSKPASFVGAFLYLYVPYRFSATYVSGAFGIVLAFVFAPLIFYSLHGLIEKNSNRYFLILSLSLALLLISHNVSAMIFITLAFCYGLFLFFQKKGNNSLKKIILALLLAFGLSSFFLIPMVSDLNYVNLGKNIAVNYNDHWPSLRQLIYSPWGYGYSNTGYEHDGMSFQLGIAQWLILFFSLIIVLYKIISKSKFNPKDKLALLFLFLFFIVLFFTLKSSSFFWENLPLIRQIQFPWRLLMAQMIITSFLASWLISYFSSKKIIQKLLIISLIFIAFWGNRNHLRTFSSARFSDSHYINNNDYLFYGSTDIAWESLPKWATFSPQYRPRTLIFNPGDTKYLEEKPNQKEKFRISFDSQKSTDIIANVFYYPNWNLRLFQNDNLIASSLNYDQDTGLIKFTIPSGKTTAVLTYKQTTIQTIANTITIISAFIFLFLASKLVLKKRVK